MYIYIHIVCICVCMRVGMEMAKNVKEEEEIWSFGLVIAVFLHYNVSKHCVRQSGIESVSARP